MDFDEFIRLASQTVIIILNTYMSLIGFGFIVFDVTDLVHYLVRRRPRRFLYSRPGKNSQSIVSSTFFRMIQCAYIFANILAVLGKMENIEFLKNHEDGNTYLIITTTILSTCIFLQFLQFLPYVGYLIIGFQRTMMTYLSFSVLLYVIFSSFSIAFYTLAQISCYEPRVDSFQEGQYLALQIFLHQIDTRARVSTYITEWCVFQILTVFVCSILLLNFCIAVLSYSFQDVVANKSTIQRLQFLSVSTLVEKRTEWLIRPVYRLLKKEHRPTGVLLVTEVGGK